MKKRLVGAAVAVCAVAAGATTVTAQESTPPTVSVALGKSAVTLQGTENVQGGTTRVTLTNPDGIKENFGVIFALRSGVTLDDFKQKVADGGLNAVWGLGTVEYSAALLEADSTHTTTLDLEPGASYLAVQGKAEDPKDWVYGTFNVADTRSSATRPSPDATVNMDDFAFAGSARLPRNGLIRFRNIGAAPHFTVAFPMKPTVSKRKLGRVLRSNNEKKFDALVGGPPTEIQGLISPGAANDNQVRFARAGRYALVCFFSTRENRQGHHAVGMYRLVTVR